MRGVAIGLGVPVTFVLGVRLLMAIVFQGEHRNGDNLLKGLLQGVLMYHAILSAHQPISVALFLGIGGRLLGDFAVRRDGWRAASTLLGIAFGVLMADVVSYVNPETWRDIIWVSDLSDDRNAESSRRRRHMSVPRRIEDLPNVYEELSSIDSRSRAEDAAAASGVEKEVARLRSKALHAAGQRRRFREERKWAWSQGNFARALQLRWQVKKYQALAESFTREADQKLIEADRAKRKPSSPPREERFYPPNGEPAPFVQVVVERGCHEHGMCEEEAPESRDLSYRVASKTTSRVMKAEVTQVKSGMVLDSSGHLSHTTHTKDSRGLGDPSPPSSDTWSRQLD